MSTLSKAGYADWISRMDDEILALPVESVCGADCARVIAAATAFLQACPDLRDTEQEEQVICAAIQQCETFYFG